MPKMPVKLEVRDPPLVVKCVACGGTGFNSRGNSCWPCLGKGWKVAWRQDVTAEEWETLRLQAAKDGSLAKLNFEAVAAVDQIMQESGGSTLVGWSPEELARMSGKRKVGKRQ